jgi:WD40 repeat protein
VSAVAFLPDGRHALSGSYDSTLRLWDLATGGTLRTLEGHSSGVNAVAMLADGTRALSGSDDKTLRLWDLASGESLRTLGHASKVTGVALSARLVRTDQESGSRWLENVGLGLIPAVPCAYL